MQFTVVAGKYETDGSRNYKFCSDTLATFEEAFNLYLAYCNYPFCEIEVGVGKDIYIAEVRST